MPARFTRRLSVLLVEPGALRCVFWTGSGPHCGMAAGEEAADENVGTRPTDSPFAAAAAQDQQEETVVWEDPLEMQPSRALSSNAHFSLARAHTDDEDSTVGGGWEEESSVEGGRDCENEGSGGDDESPPASGANEAVNAPRKTAPGAPGAAGPLLSGASLGQEVTQLLQHLLLSSAVCEHGLEGLEAAAHTNADAVGQLRQDMDERLGSIERQLAAITRHLGVKEPRVPLQPIQRRAAISGLTASQEAASQAAMPIKVPAASKAPAISKVTTKAPAPTKAPTFSKNAIKTAGASKAAAVSKVTSRAPAETGRALGIGTRAATRAAALAAASKA